MFRTTLTARSIPLGLTTSVQTLKILLTQSKFKSSTLTPIHSYASASAPSNGTPRHVNGINVATLFDSSLEAELAPSATPCA